MWFPERALGVSPILAVEVLKLRFRMLSLVSRMHRDRRHMPYYKHRSSGSKMSSSPEPKLYQYMSCPHFRIPGAMLAYSTSLETAVLHL